MATATTQARMKSPAVITPGAMQALLALGESAKNRGVPQRTLDLVHLCVSQVNSCSFCVGLGYHQLKQAGETDDRLFAVAAWRDAPYFTDAERAALALAEAVTQLSDRSDPVPDEVWDEAARLYDERPLAALLINIAATNAWNRLNAATRQPGDGWKAWS
ncbi:MAG TPA: carboxymuconolactone decarboxylase family protein [Candidatus Dormibacteraeota bacterium]|nr:carboxymuconolactone decarboxylase family protein [Candidatus Dormibacteraeota bacterium]